MNTCHSLPGIDRRRSIRLPHSHKLCRLTGQHTLVYLWNDQTLCLWPGWLPSFLTLWLLGCKIPVWEQKCVPKVYGTLGGLQTGQA